MLSYLESWKKSLKEKKAEVDWLTQRAAARRRKIFISVWIVNTLPSTMSTTRTSPLLLRWGNCAYWSCVAHTTRCIYISCDLTLQSPDPFIAESVFTKKYMSWEMKEEFCARFGSCIVFQAQLKNLLEVSFWESWSHPFNKFCPLPTRQKRQQILILPWSIHLNLKFEVYFPYIPFQN